MKRHPIVFAALVAATIGPAAAATAPGADPKTPGVTWSRLRIPEHGTLVFPLPADWRVLSSMGRRVGQALDVEIGPGAVSKAPFKVQLAVEPPPRRREVTTAEALRRYVEEARDAMAPLGANPAFPVQALPGQGLTGCFLFSFTDPAPKDGWPFMTHGSALVEDLLVTFSVYTNQGSRDKLAPALEMVQGMKWEPPSHEEAAALKARSDAEAARWTPIAIRDFEHLQFTLGLPDKTWALWMDLPGYKADRRETAPDGRRATVAVSDPGRQLFVSATIARQVPFFLKTAAACQLIFPGPPPEGQDQREEEKDGMHLVHYFIPAVADVLINQQHTEAFLYHDGACIDVHVSKTMYTPRDKRYIDAALSGLKLVTK